MVITSKKILNLLCSILLVLLAAHLVSVFIEIKYGTDSFIYSLFSKWDFGTEKNFPTFFSAVNLLITGLLLTLISHLKKEEKEPWILWLGLALIFFYLCADEFICIHEHFSKPTRNVLGAQGFLYFAWVIPYSIIALGVGLFYLRFVLKLPAKTRNMFFLCGSMFVFAAIGMELIEGNEAFIHGNAGKETFLWYFSYTIEEFLEMFSIILFISTLVSYITDQFSPFSFKFENENKEKRKHHSFRAIKAS